MGHLARSIPWISDSIPWIGRSIPWILRSMGTFRWKMGSDLRHIVAKMAFLGVHSGEGCAEGAQHQVFLFFAHLRATDGARENNRFSVLKTRLGGTKKRPHPCGAAACRLAARRGARQRLRARLKSWSASLMHRYQRPSTFTGLNMKPMVLGVVSAESVFSKKRMSYFTSFCPSELNE